MLGFKNDLTAQFTKLKRQPEPEEAKNFLLNRKGLLQGLKQNQAPSSSPQFSRANLATKGSSNSSESQSDDSIEMRQIGQQPISRSLPPMYVDIQEEVESILLSAEQQMKELVKMQQKRIRDSFFDEDVTLQSNIALKSREILQQIKQAEKKLKELIKVQTTDKCDEQIRVNMQTLLAERLKKITMDFRRNEKEHFAKIQELHGGGITPSNGQRTSQSDELLNFNTDCSEQALDTQNSMQDTQSREIQQLAQSIQDLATLFKDLSVMVVEQGTVLDRIDFNIQEAQQHTEKANVHLKKALEYEQAGTARKVIIFLASAILICILILMLRWFY